MKRGVWFALFCSALVLSTNVARAQAVCYRFFNNVSTFGQTGNFFDDAESLLAAGMDHLNNTSIGCDTGTDSGPSDEQYCNRYTAGSCTGAVTGEGGSQSCTYTVTREPRGTMTSCSPAGWLNCTPSDLGMTAAYEVNPGGCPEEECEAEIGHGYWVTSTSPVSGSKWCQALCQMEAGTSVCGGPPGLQTCNTWSSVTALTCEGSPDTDGDGLGDDGGPADDPPDGAEPDEDGPGDSGDAGESCIDIGDGEYCASPKGDKSCGYVNDTYTCLDKIKEDECKVLGDGGRVCGPNAATTPPVPDNGTPGVLATPDGQMTGATPGSSGGIPGSTVNNYTYYGPGTVAGSSRDPGTTGASGASASGSPHAPVPGEDSGDGDGGDGDGGACEGVDCNASLPELEDIGTLSTAFSGFWSDLQEVPVIEAAAGIAPSFGSGSCPDWSTSVALYSASIDIDFTSMCSIWTDISPALGAVCLVMFGLLAFRILFSA